MSLDDELESIAVSEAEDTVTSIGNLDSICDTTLVAVTFLLAAVGTWTGFAYERLSDTGLVRPLFVILVVVNVALVAACVDRLVRALVPRLFYGSSVGEPFVELGVPPSDDSRDDVDYDAIVSEAGDGPRSTDHLEEWLSEYSPDGVGSRSEFAVARLFNYKRVARTKAEYTARGLSWFRASVVLFVVVVAVGSFGPFLSS